MALRTFKMKRVVVVSLLALCFFSATPAQSQSKDETHPPDLTTSITNAANALQGLMKSDGAFVYESRLDGQSVEPHYNLVRHAGALYALNAYDAKYPSATMESTIEKGLGFIKRNTYAVPTTSPPATALFTLSHNNEYTVLGATALGLVAFLTTPFHHETADDKELYRRLGHFLLFMQKPDGSFYSAYNFAKDSRDDSFSSLYYPGEASLALIDLYKWDTSSQKQQWGEAAKRALLYLAETRGITKDYPPDSWSLIATKALFESGFPITEAERSKLIEHLENVVLADRRLQQLDNIGSPTFGALTPGGNTTQTSSRLEGLIAALDYIRNPQLREDTQQSIQKAMHFLLASQRQNPPLQGAFPETILADDDKHFLVRIDYIQHALSAMLLYQDNKLLTYNP